MFAIHASDFFFPGEEDGFTNVVSRRPRGRRRSVTSSVGTASTRSVRSGRSVAVPCLSGFIDSWNPFPGNERYFDTPPPSPPVGSGQQIRIQVW